MTYQTWHDSHAKKHKIIVDKLTNLTDDEIIDYFDYENMKINEKDFCLLYTQNKKCHDMENLNCYLCACPNFRVNSTKSSCDINSKDGGSIKSNDGFIHQDCSNCTVPHKKSYVKSNFNKNWNITMSQTFSPLPKV